MIGIVVVSHGNIGTEMVGAARRIIPESSHMTAVAVDSDDPPEKIRQQISEAIRSIDAGDGILILTDMFGGTPSNVCLAFLEPSRIEVVSGFNLPMLIKLANTGKDSSFDDTVNFIQQYGQRNIVIASHILGSRPHRSEKSGSEAK